MAFRRRLGNLAGQLLDKRLDRRNQEYEAELRMKQLQESERINSEQQFLGTLLKDPAMVQRWLQQTGRQQVGGMPVSPIVPTRDDAMRGVKSKIAETSKLP